MRAATSSQDTQGVLDWLKEQARRRHLGDFDAKLARREGNWLHIAVKLGGVKDVSDRATILVELEDEWDAQPDTQGWHLMLIPSAG